MPASLTSPSFDRFVRHCTAVGAALALSAPGWAWAQGQASSTPVVPVVQVAAQRVGQGLSLDGTVQAVKQSTLSAQAQGRVMQLMVKAGDKVRAGQVLAVIDDQMTQSGVAQAQAGAAQAQAGVAQAQAQLAQAELAIKRTRDLHAKGFMSQAALDTAEAQYLAAKAGLAQAQAAQNQAKAGTAQANLAQGYTRLTAPYDGLVLSTHTDVGSLAAPGAPVVTVYAPQPLRAVVYVPVSRAALTDQASNVQVTLPDGTQVTPSSQTRLTAADPVSQTVEWRLNLPEKSAAQLMPGQQVSVSFGGASAQRLVVPSQALLRRGELTAVYIAPEGGKGFVLRAVRTGADHGAAGVEIVSGLRGGERVATDPVRAGLAGAVAQ